MARIWSVSNRLPVSVGETIRRSSGGLVAAMEGVANDENTISWIGWPGTGVEAAQRPELAAKLRNEFGYEPVFLTDEEVEAYYEGFSNASLWPIVHYMPMYMRHENAWWEAYQTVNKRFAQAAAERASEDDIVWIHDYHLMLAPSMLRQLRPELKIGFFLHTPFPSYEVFRCHPRRTELLKGLLGADQIGFHTFGYLRHFRSALLRVAGIEADMNRVFHEHGTTHLGVYPIGINAAKFEAQLASKEHADKLAEYRNSYGHRRVVLSVERLDYTKGILHRLEAIEKYLAAGANVDEVYFVMICVPSREGVPQYQELIEEVSRLVGQINGHYATVESVPVHFLNQSVDFTELCALYALADVALITPLIDGMNLVAKEYVACRTEDTGALILSEFAGAAHELFDGLIVNPYDSDEVAVKIRDALDTVRNGASSHMRLMRDRVRRNDARHWARTFIRDLELREVQVTATYEGEQASQAILAQVDRVPGKIALFLDYDGTLREIESRPTAAAPTQEILDLLQELEQCPRTDVFLVSGRSQQDLAYWFSHYRITLISEAGLSYRSPNSQDWVPMVRNLDVSWMNQIIETLRQFEDSTPGSRLEEKESALVWHYRRSDPEFGQWKARQLVGELSEATSNLPIEVHHGKAIVEITPIVISKGGVVERLVSTAKYDLVICAGDDVSDDAMFDAKIDPLLLSIRIGSGATAARYRLRHPRALRSLLRQIVQRCTTPTIEQRG